jgi:hypothetical protein
MQEKTKVLLVVVFLCLVVAIITKFMQKDTNECYVDTDCNGYREYCELNPDKNKCYVFDCGNYPGLGIGDFWTCEDTNFCLLMCRYNSTTGGCVYNHNLVQAYKDKGCKWHKTVITEPEGGFKIGEEIYGYKWVCEIGGERP